ncbi:diguanylate cyclase (GGDEF)-like protein [Aequitasia blattaphilus]|uniref:Diguanylate cyclase n=1 Tax=Aequitasia blattaphilus TaxID=2949332 RepID=A0ABT1E955_9FIRM|nr:diguanylate cyclase [Aequitasia blattaphilus]MCP1102357.1 diguanylate cyclase [Aequitasia blattaphilus]MCR8614997.1 diguanylate cyclase [Aequitasia blattaphilus]
MIQSELRQFYGNINKSVVVIQDYSNPVIVYENKKALFWLNPFWNMEQDSIDFFEFLEMPQDEYDTFIEILQKSGMVEDFLSKVTVQGEKQVPVVISASEIELSGQKYGALFFDTVHDKKSEEESNAKALLTISSLSYKSENIEEAIDNVLAFSGNYVDVDRAYIFESVSEISTSNTYEWCSVGTKPSISELKNLPKDEYSYEQIVWGGMAITDDIRTMSEEDRAILEPQGIKALAIIPMFSAGKPLGYVGFDDCHKYRKWTQSEIDFLNELSSMLASMLVQRDLQKSLIFSRDIFETVTDSTDTLIYVSDIDTHELLFVNSNMASSVGIEKDKLIGMKCWEVLQAGSKGPCSFCPLKKMYDEEGNQIKDYYRWEFRNTINGKWYLIRDQIIKWTDGRDVHIETATEITNRKEYESHLEYIASTDIMTGAYTREWGRKILENILSVKDRAQENSLIFIDLDGLKTINDRYGHTDGDFMIIKTLEIIKSNIRKSDLICRWGGDEFIMIIRGGIQECEIVMQKIKESLKEYNEKREIPFHLDFSYGIEEINSATNVTIDELIKNADQKMYEQKNKKQK